MVNDTFSLLLGFSVTWLLERLIQEPTLTYTNPETKRKFTRDEFVAFAENYLGVDVIFWSTTSPWLQTKAPD